MSNSQLDLGSSGMVVSQGDNSFFDDSDVFVPNIEISDTKEVPFVDIGNNYTNDIGGIEIDAPSSKIKEPNGFNKVNKFTNNTGNSNMGSPTIEFSGVNESKPNSFNSSSTIEIDPEKQDDSWKKKSGLRRKKKPRDVARNDYYQNTASSREPKKYDMPTYDPNPNNIPEKKPDFTDSNNLPSVTKDEKINLVNDNQFSDNDSYASSPKKSRPTDLDFSFLQNKEKMKKVRDDDDMFSIERSAPPTPRSGYSTESEIRPSTYSFKEESQPKSSYNTYENTYQPPREEPRYDPTPPPAQQPYPPQEYSSNYPDPYDDNEPVFKNEAEEKMYYLIELQGLENKGVKLSRDFSMKSSLEDIKMEHRAQSGLLNKEASVKWMKKALVMCVSGMCLLNKKYDPIGAKLDGWDESVMENVDDYTGIFERLHKKYQGTAEMAPELELLMALAGSAFTFHITNSLFKTAIPNLASTIQSNPNLMSGLFGAVNEAAEKTKTQQAQGMYMPGGTMGYNGSGSNYSQPMQPQMPNFNGGPQYMGQQPPQPSGGKPMNGPSLDLGSLLSSMGLGMGSGGGNQGPGPVGTPLPQTAGLGNIGAGLASFNDAIQNPPPGAVGTREVREPPLGDVYRKQIERDQQRNVARAVNSVVNPDDTQSLMSDASDASEIRTVSIGRAAKKGRKKNKDGGLVINL